MNKVLNFKKNTNKAITLIALIITVVVLLLLAGVSIVTLGEKEERNINTSSKIKRKY